MSAYAGTGPMSAESLASGAPRPALGAPAFDAPLQRPLPFPLQRPLPRPAPGAPAPGAPAPAAPAPAPRTLRRLRSAALPVGVAALDGLVVNAVHAGPVLWGALAAAGALVLRRRQPELALAAGIPGLYLGHLAFAPLIALYFLAVHRRSAVPGAVGAVLVALAHFLPLPLGDVTLLRLDHDTVLDALDSCALGVGAFVLGRSARYRRERLREITESRERENRLLAQHTLATERARLAREMHDVVAHKVSLISLQAGVLQVTEPGARAVRETAGVIRGLSVDTLTELQHLVGVLRADGGNTGDLAPQPRLADLGRLVEESALPVELHLGDLGDLAGPLPEAVERAAYRTVQEALTNVRKHAPGARAEVRVGPAGGRLHVEVRNTAADGSAVAPGLPAGGNGLVGLRERAQLLGGSFTSAPLPGGGFLVRAEYPV
ncbi:sensor histidine kinase [Streptomyces microflavus]|uniref:sensor histidine kinase n=1 Tax=Streptomyces microflavus TaxID=1919 RepID=UPI0033C8DCBC